MATAAPTVSGLQGMFDSPSAGSSITPIVVGSGSTLTPRDVRPLTGLRETHHFSVAYRCGIMSLAADTQRQCLIVRTKNKSSPILVYDYNGQLQEKLGGDITGLVDGVDRGISLDTKRSLYLRPVEGALVLVDRAGKVTATVKVGRRPIGISYSKKEDVYVVSDWNTHMVYIIDASNHQIITVFGGYGSGNGEFNGPHTVHVGHVAGINHPVIVVSDRLNCRVQVHSIEGNHIRTYGSHGSGDGQLLYPTSVTTDPAGRIIVNDDGNTRVVSYWEEDGKDQWCCLLDSTQLRGMKPQHASCDPQTRVLTVSTADNKIHLFK